MIRFIVLKIILLLFILPEVLSQGPGGGDFYFYPTPSELFEIIDKDQLSFNKNLINPTSNETNYILSHSKYLNLGVYMSDLAYSAFFHKKDESINYLKAISRLSNDLLISADLKKHFSRDVFDNIDYMDSIYNITNTHYYDIMQDLDENNSSNVIYIITTGAYIETYYIALNLLTEYKEDDVLLLEIAKQKPSILNLHKFSQICSDEPGFSQIIQYQTDLIDVFNKFKEEEGTKRTFRKTSDGRIEFIGGSKFSMTEEQFEELKTTVTKLRDEITN